MNYNHLLSNFQFDRESLLNYGFVEVKPNLLEYRVDLPNSLYVRLRISPGKLEVDVFDAIFNDKYQPFVSGHGGSAIKSEVRELVERILAQCAKKVDAKKQVIEFMQQRYGTEPEFPWEEYPNHCTFKARVSQKWYALIMRIQAKSLGLHSEENIDVINVKLPPEQISKLIDGHKYFPAYHMNKKYWLTVVLNADTDFVTLEQLIAISHDLVEK